MKHRLLLPTLVLAAVAVLLTACGAAAKPRGWAAPVMTDDIILVSTSRGRLDALDANTGALKWRFPNDWALKDIKDKKAEKPEAIYAPPIVTRENVVYVGGYNGYVYALQQSAPGVKDRILWVHETGGPIIGGMALDSATDTLFVTSDDGRLYAFSGSDGSTRFPPVRVGDRIWGPPLVYAGNVYVGSTDGRLAAFDARSGQGVAAWTPFVAAGGIVAGPILSGRTILVGGFDARLYAIDADTGAEKWRFEATNWIWSRPEASSGTVYIGDFNGNVYALNLSDGKPLWDRPFSAGDGASAAIRSGPVLIGSILVIATQDGALYGIDAGTGAKKWGPASVGAAVLSDLIVEDSTVLVAPSGCAQQLQPDESKRQVLFYRVDVATGKLEPVLSDKGC